MKMDTDFELVYVVVEWHDAHVGTDGWEARQDLVDDGPAVIESCGFLLTPEQGGKKKSRKHCHNMVGRRYGTFCIPHS